MPNEDEDLGGFEPEALEAISGAKKSLSESGIGHNSGADPDHIDAIREAQTPLTTAARDKLKQFVAKIETLEDEKKEVAEHIRDVYAEAKALGYDTKALRGVVRFRKQDRQDREEQQAILDTYLLATGDIEFYD